MIHKQLSLSDIVDYFKKNKSKDAIEILHEVYGYLLAASAIAAVVVAPDPAIAVGAFSAAATMSSVKMSGLLSWLSDRFKYGEKKRESFALERYEISGIANFMLFNIAIRHSFEETFIAVLQQVIGELNLDEQEKQNFSTLSAQVDAKINLSPVWMNVHIRKEDLANHALEIVAPLLHLLEKNQDLARKSKKNVDKLDLAKLKEKFTENAFLQYNAFLINFSTEFPEFALWVDLSLKQKMVKELNASLSELTESDRALEQQFIKSVETIIKKIESLQDQSFCKGTGFPSLLKSYDELFKTQTEHLLFQLNIKSRENIQAHQNQIKAELDKPLIDNDDVEDIVYPKIKDIYISQSFEAITYQKKRHGRAFLSPGFWEKNVKKGENIGNELLESLVNPNYCGKPIIILGNPGAGKSMLSKMLAGALVETNDFIPFLIKLRNVATGTTNISEHIAKGLSKSIENINDVNWIDWAKEFRDRIPVIILDGFDELMRFSQSELNNYINAIKEFQETALSHGICTRVILTSRIAVMQDVSIPEYTRIIKLNGFDQERKALWVSIWNRHQNKEGYKFELPENENIQQLSQEPLLLFMLGVYDFESSALQQMAQTGNFSQSKLYDSLLDNFALRQLEKNDKYRNATAGQKKVEEELFRLRLGMIALLMFLNDATHKDIHNLNDELEAFELNNSIIQKENILGGFFFIHENKSVTEGDVERYNYEFLHKTFGEFLAADFLLRVTAKQFDIRSREKLASDTTFRFCFGYNWLHKHANILNFLMEHCPAVIGYPGDMATYIIENNIKKELKNLFNKGFQGFPVSDFIILKPHDVVDHLAIYSQNLVLLWRAITGARPKFSFELFDLHDHITNEAAETVKYEAQDRTELNKNKILWKRLCNLWSLVGNKFATAQLTEWLAVEEQPEQLLLVKTNAEVTHNFYNASAAACNDFEKILSLFDFENSYGSSDTDLLRLIGGIIEKKPELQTLGIDALLYRLSNKGYMESLEALDWLRNQQLTVGQTHKLVQVVVDHRRPLPFRLKYEVFAMHKNHVNMDLIYREMLRDIEAYPAEFRKDDLLGIVNDILSSSTRENLFHHEADAELVLNYILILKKLNISWITEPRLHKGLYADLFHNLTRDMVRRKRSPREIPVYIRALAEIQQLQPFNSRMRIEYFDEVVHDLSNEIYELVNHDPLLAVEYLNAMSLLNSNFKMKSVHQKKIVSALQELSDNADFFMSNDVSVTLSFIRSINKLSATGTMKVRLNPHLIEEGVYRMLRQLDYDSRRGAWQFGDYIYLLKELKTYAPKGRFAHGAQLDEALDRLYNEFRHYARESSMFNLELLKFILDVKSLGLADDRHIAHILRDMTEFFLHDINYIGKQFPSAAADYLICLLERLDKLDVHENPALADLIREVGNLKLPRQTRKKVALLLIKQGANPGILGPYVESFPALAKIYYDNQELPGQLSALLQEMDA